MSAPTVAGPRRAMPTGVYTGEELQTRSARPGAYDAMRLPSRFGDRVITPGEAPRIDPAEALAPAPAPLLHRHAPPAPPSLREIRSLPGAYEPKRGSVAYKVLMVLRRDGGHLSAPAIAHLFNVSAHTLTALFKAALKHGALERHGVGILASYSLPGYVMPADAVAEPAARSEPRSPATVRALADALAQPTVTQLNTEAIERIEATAAALVAAFEALQGQARMAAADIQKSAQQLQQALRGLDPITLSRMRGA